MKFFSINSHYLNSVKRTALLFLTVIYLLSCIGIEMSCFYCCGKPAAVKLMHSAADYTTSKPDKVKDDCCKSKSISLKLKDAHVYAVSFSLNHPSRVLISSFNSLDNDAPAKIFDSKMAYSGDRPPGYSKIPIYIQYCIYRI